MLLIAAVSIALAALFGRLWRAAKADAAAARAELCQVIDGQRAALEALAIYTTTKDRAKEVANAKETEVANAPDAVLAGRANTLFPGLPQRPGEPAGKN